MNEQEFLVWLKKYLSDKQSLTERQVINLKNKIKEIKPLPYAVGIALESLTEALDTFNEQFKTNVSIESVSSFKTIKEKNKIPETASSTIKAVKSIKKKLKAGKIDKNIFWKNI